MTYTRNLSIFVPMSDGSDCFFDILLNVLFWQIRHFFVHYVEKRYQTILC